MTGQSRRQSAAETATNTAVGFVGSYAITSGFMHSSTLSTDATALAIVVGCTVWSLARGYWLRRLFNKLSTRRNG